MKSLAELKLMPGEVVFLDRTGEGVATLLLGPEGKCEETVARDQIPEAAREGDRLRMGPDGGLIVDPEATEAGRAAVADLMADLLAAPAPDPAPALSSPPKSDEEP